MEFSVRGILRGLAYKPSKYGPVVVIAQEVEASNGIGQLGMFCGEQVSGEYRTSNGEWHVTGTLLRLDYRPAEEGAAVQIQLQVLAHAELGALGMAVGSEVEAVYAPWQLSLDDAGGGVRQGAGGQMPLSAPGTKEEPSTIEFTHVQSGRSATVTGEQLAGLADGSLPLPSRKQGGKEQ